MKSSNKPPVCVKQYNYCSFTKTALILDNPRRLICHSPIHFMIEVFFSFIQQFKKHVTQKIEFFYSVNEIAINI